MARVKKAPHVLNFLSYSKNHDEYFIYFLKLAHCSFSPISPSKTGSFDINLHYHNGTVLGGGADIVSAPRTWPMTCNIQAKVHFLIYGKARYATVPYLPSARWQPHKTLWKWTAKQGQLDLYYLELLLFLFTLNNNTDILSLYGKWMWGWLPDNQLCHRKWGRGRKKRKNWDSQQRCWNEKWSDRSYTIC